MNSKYTGILNALARLCRAAFLVSAAIYLNRAAAVDQPVAWDLDREFFYAEVAEIGDRAIIANGTDPTWHFERGDDPWQYELWHRDPITHLPKPMPLPDPNALEYGDDISGNMNIKACECDNQVTVFRGFKKFAKWHPIYDDVTDEGLPYRRTGTETYVWELPFRSDVPGLIELASECDWDWWDQNYAHPSSISLEGAGPGTLDLSYGGLTLDQNLLSLFNSAPICPRDETNEAARYHPPVYSFAGNGLAGETLHLNIVGISQWVVPKVFPRTNSGQTVQIGAVVSGAELGDKGVKLAIYDPEFPGLRRWYTFGSDSAIAEWDGKLYDSYTCPFGFDSNHRPCEPTLPPSDTALKYYYANGPTVGLEVHVFTRDHYNHAKRAATHVDGETVFYYDMPWLSAEPPNATSLDSGTKSPALKMPNSLHPSGTITNGIDLGTGRFQESVEDLRIPSPGIDFVIARTYNSANGWIFSYDIELSGQSGESRTLYPGRGLRECNETGRDYLLLYDGNHTDVYWSTADPIHCAGCAGACPMEWRNESVGRKITRDPQDGSFTVEFPDQSKWHFADTSNNSDTQFGFFDRLQISSMEDRTGTNKLNFTYNSGLTEIEDSLGQKVIIHYDIGGTWLIDRITGPGGRIVTYEYDDDLRLTDVTDALNHVTHYEYMNAGPYDNRLKSITDAKNQKYLELDYSTAEDASDPSFGKIISENWGGNSVTIEYEDLSAALDENKPISKATVTDRNGNSFDYFYDWFYRCRKKVDHDGGELTTRFAWNEDSRLTNLTLPSGQSMLFEYGDPDDLRHRGDVVSIHHTPGSGGGTPYFEQFEYDPEHGGAEFISSYTDGLNRVTTYGRDEHGNCTSINPPISAASESFTYFDNGQLETHTGTENGSGDRETENFTYDGALVHTISRGGLVTTIEHDGVGNITSITDPEGRSVYFTGDVLNHLGSKTTELGRATSLTYDANYNVESIQYPNGLTATYGYDELNHVTSIERSGSGIGTLTTGLERDSVGNITTITPPRGAAISCGYNARNLMTSAIRGDKNYTFQYDAAGNMTQSSLGSRQTSLRYDGYDNLIGKTDPAQNSESFPRDVAGNPTSWSFSGQDVSINAAIQHDDLDRLISSTIGTATTSYEYSGNSDLTKLTDPNSNEFNCQYDNHYRPQVIADPSGNVLTTTYDGASNIIGLLEQTESSENLNTVCAYDSDNLIQSVTDPDQNLTQIVHDPMMQVREITNARGALTTLDRDALSRIQSIETDSDNGETLITQQGWDENSNLVSQTDPAGHMTQYLPNSVDEQSGTNYADGTNTKVVRDQYGDAITVTDANGTVFQTTYDALSRPTHRTISPGAGVSGNITHEDFVWDGLSRLTYAANDQSVISITYNDLGCVLTETVNGKTVAYTYDSAGYRTSCTFPGGRVFSLTPDPLGRLASISEGGAVIASYTYSGADGRVSQRTYGNGVITTYAYNAAKNALSITDTLGADLLTRHAMTWDPTGNKSSHTETRAGGQPLAQTFGYDLAGRMTAATSDSLSIGYALDAVGNRTYVSAGKFAGDYFSAGARAAVNQIGTTPFDKRSYDRNGNLVGVVYTTGAPGSRSYKYNCHNQLVDVHDTRAGLHVTYSYDALGRMIARTESVSGNPAVKRQEFVYSDWNLIEERDGEGNVEASYVYGARTDEIVSMRQSGCTDNYFHADDLGNVVALTDGSGHVVERYEYYDHGRAEFLTATGIPKRNGRSANPFLFNGHRLDRGTGLYDFRTRQYDPSIGQFTSRDSIGIWGDTANRGNGYAFVGNNPASGTDPFGMDGYGEGVTEFLRYPWQTNLKNRPANDSLTDPPPLIEDDSTLGQMSHGVGDAILDTASGPYRAARHPIDTLTGLAHAAANPVQTFKAAIAAGRGMAAGDLRSKARLTGNILIGGGMSAVPGTFFGRAAKAAEVGEDVGVIAPISAPAAKLHLNSNSAVSNFGIYEIKVNGVLHKVGKVDLNRITQSSGLPTRLHQQLRKIRKLHGTENVEGEVVEELGEITTAQAKAAENARLRRIYDETGIVPHENKPSFKP